MEYKWESMDSYKEGRIVNFKTSSGVIVKNSSAIPYWCRSDCPCQSYDEWVEEPFYDEWYPHHAGV